MRETIKYIILYWLLAIPMTFVAGGLIWAMGGGFKLQLLFYAMLLYDCAIVIIVLLTIYIVEPFTNWWLD